MRDNPVRTPDTIRCVEAAVGIDQRQTIVQVAEETEIHRCTIQRVMREDLDLSKKSARWIPWFWTPLPEKEVPRFELPFCQMP